MCIHQVLTSTPGCQNFFSYENNKTTLQKHTPPAMNNTWFKEKKKKTRKAKSGIKLFLLSDCNSVALKAKPPLTPIKQDSLEAITPKKSQLKHCRLPQI